MSPDLSSQRLVYAVVPSPLSVDGLPTHTHRAHTHSRVLYTQETAAGYTDLHYSTSYNTHFLVHVHITMSHKYRGHQYSVHPLLTVP